MENLKHQECNLNIWDHLPDEIWSKVPKVYESLPGWLGFGKNGQGEEGIPYWFTFDEEKKSIIASVEPSGLHISGNMDDDEWNVWIATFKRTATEILGFKVGEIEKDEVDYEIEWIR